MFIYVFYVCFKLFISNIMCRSGTRISNSLVSAEQLAKILDVKLEEKLVPLNQTVMELRKAVDEVVKHSKFIDDRYDELLRQIKTSNEESKALLLENKVLKKTLQELEQKHTTLLQEINEKNQYDRRECLEIRGIPQPDDGSSESTDQIVKDIGKLVDVDIMDQDISVSHRLPQRKQMSCGQMPRRNVGPPPIIVKFTRRNIKERLYGARRKLSESTTSDLGYFEENKIYLAEILTEINRELFRACLSVKKELKFNYIWTYNGRIFLLENRESSVVHIKSKDDLDQLKTNR